MKTTLLFISVFLSVSLFGQEPSFEWGITIGGPDLNNDALVTTDNSGNPIVGGLFENQISLEENGIIFNGNDYRDGFLAKYDSNNGNLIWAKQLNCSAGWLELTKIQVNSNDNVIVVGYLQEDNGGALDLNPDPIDEELINTSDEIGFILCLDSFGDYLWSKSIFYEGDNFDWATRVDNFKILDQDNMLFTIYAGMDPPSSIDEAPPVNFGLNYIIDLSYASTVTGDPNAYEGYILIKTDIDGEVIFSNVFTGGTIWPYDSFQPIDFVEYDNGSIMAIGDLYQTADIDPNENVEVYHSDTGTVAAMIKLTNNGDYSNSYTFSCLNPNEMSSGSTFQINTIAIDENQNIVINGVLRDTIDIEPISASMENINAPIYTTVGILKYDENINLISTSLISPFEGPDGTPGGPQPSENAITHIDNNRIFFGGGTNYCNQYFNSSATSLGEGNSIYIGEINTTGNLIWSKNIDGNPGSQMAWTDINSGEYFITTLSNDIIDMDPDSGIVNSLDYGNNINLIKFSDETATTSELSTSKNLIQILDLMGRETSFKPNTPLIYVYDDGSIEKVFTIE